MKAAHHTQNKTSILNSFMHWTLLQTRIYCFQERLQFLWDLFTTYIQKYARCIRLTFSAIIWCEHLQSLLNAVDWRFPLRLTSSTIYLLRNISDWHLALSIEFLQRCFGNNTNDCCFALNIDHFIEEAELCITYDFVPALTIEIYTCDSYFWHKWLPMLTWRRHILTLNMRHFDLHVLHTNVLWFLEPFGNTMSTYLSPKKQDQGLMSPYINNNNDNEK